MITQELKQKLNEQKNRVGLVGTKLEINEIPENNSFSAGITEDWKTILMNYGEELDLIPDKNTERFTEKRKIKDAYEKIGEDILEHECGHRENPTETRYGCPYTVEIHDAMKNGVSRALAEKGKQGLEDYVLNAVEDVFDNIVCRRKTDFSGQTLFWNNQGVVNSEKGKFSPFYETFVKLNLILGKGLSDTTLLRRFYTNDKNVKKAIHGFLGNLKYQLGARDEKNLISLHEKPEFDVLFNRDLDKREELMESLSYDFAFHTSDLLEDIPKEEMFGNSEEENPFEKQINIPKVKQKIAYKRYKQGKGPAVHRDFQEQLYDLYRRISKQIKIKTSYFTDSSGMPLVHFGKRFADERDTGKKFNFKGVGINGNGDLAIKTSRHSLEYPVSYKIHPRNFPKFKIALIDRSGSMAESAKGSRIGDTSFIPWGDKSKIHFTYKGYFGIDNYFSSQGILPYIESSALGFSEEEIIKGNSKDVAKKILQNPSGGTSLDINTLERELTKDSLLVSITDGQFSFDREDKKKIKEKIKQGIDYVHFQIGADTEYSKFLKQEEVPVFNIRGDDDLSNLMVNFVSHYYNPNLNSRQKTE